MSAKAVISVSVLCTDSGKVLDIGLKFAFFLISFLLAAWRMKKGFRNGMMKEIVNILSTAVSCVSIVLIFLTVSSVMAKTFSMLTVCVLGLIGIGIVFKLCKLIFAPVTAIVNISIINGLDKIAGAVLGLGEAIICSWFLYHIMGYFGIYINL